MAYNRYEQMENEMNRFEQQISNGRFMGHRPGAPQPPSNMSLRFLPHVLRPPALGPNSLLPPPPPMGMPAHPFMPPPVAMMPPPIQPQAAVLSAPPTSNATVDDGFEPVIQEEEPEEPSTSEAGLSKKKKKKKGKERDNYGAMDDGVGWNDGSLNVSGTSGKSAAMAAYSMSASTTKKIRYGKKDWPAWVKKRQKLLLRTCGEEVWEDPTLSEWDASDFRMFCGDLGNEVSDELLAKTFRRYPSFQKAKVIRDKRTNKSKGFGFVSFKDPHDFIRALKEMDGKYVGNRPIKLRKSQWKERSLFEVKKKIKEKKKLGFKV